MECIHVLSIGYTCMYMYTHVYDRLQQLMTVGGMWNRAGAGWYRLDIM